MDYNGSSIFALALLNKAKYENVIEDVADGAQDRRFSRTLRLPAAHAVECRVEEVVPGNDAAGAHLANYRLFCDIDKKARCDQTANEKIDQTWPKGKF